MVYWLLCAAFRPGYPARHNDGKGEVISPEATKHNPGARKPRPYKMDTQ